MTPEFFHYTSAAGGQAIWQSGIVKRGMSGLIWFTPDLYDAGHVAAQRLATDPASPRQMVLAFTRDDLEGLQPDWTLHLVEPRYLDGVIDATGGGTELTVDVDVRISDTVRVLPLREP